MHFWSENAIQAAAVFQYTHLIIWKWIKVNVVREIYPEIEEKLDVNHAGKNEKKKLVKIRKGFPALLPIQIDRICNHLRNCAYACEGDLQKFERFFLNFFRHSYGLCNENWIAKKSQKQMTQFQLISKTKKI